MTGRPRSVPLAVRRADAADLLEQIRSHRHQGDRCKPPCKELVAMQAELKAIRDELKSWFDPGPDQQALFDLPGAGQ